MMIHNGQTAAVIHGLQEAIQSGKQWLGIDQSIQQVSKTDLHFFESHERAIDFREFNQQRQKDVALLSVELTYEYLVDRLREAHGIGQTQPSIVIDVDFIQGLYENVKVDLLFAHLVEEMDAFDWSKVFYDPLEANTEAESFEDKVQFNRLETLMEGLSSVAQTNEHSQEKIATLLHRYWDGESMASQIEMVLNGNMTGREKNIDTLQEPVNYLQKVNPENRLDPDQNPLYNKDGNAFTDAIIDHWEHQQLVNHKTNVMNTENLEYLEKQLLYSGFGEGLKTQLERKLKEGHPDFQLNASHDFGKDKMEAVLYFSKSKQDGSDKYFFNKYDALLNNAHGNFQQTFFINNKGQSITFKEACNLLNGRSVYKELTPKDGARYKAWVKLDFNKRDENGNAKLNIFNEKYGFSLKEALGRIPLQELKDPEKMASLFTQLEGGNLVKATLIKSDREMDVQLAADPKFKTVKMFDMDGVKLYVPAQKQETQYGQAPADERRAEQGKEMEVGQPLENGKSLDKEKIKEVSQGQPVANKNKTLPQKPGKDNPLLEKKERNHRQGRKIA